jgi:RNA polymerase sigma-70 factor (ECF subfamily)
MSTTGTALLTRAARGDDAAVRECLARFGPIVWGLARRMTPTRADAEDAVQEIFLDLWTHGGRYDPAKASEEAFVAVIARRRLIDRRRRADRRPRLEELEHASEAVAPGDSPELAAEAALAARAMGGLREEQREVLRLSVAQGLTHEEIAQHTGMPLGTVKAHARRGLIRIRSILSGEPDEGEGVEEEAR